MTSPFPASSPNASIADFTHVPVLAGAAIAGLEIRDGGRYLDATLGGGGHSQRILEHFTGGQLVAIDRDATALKVTGDRLKQLYGDRLQLWQGNFAGYPGEGASFDGIIADLGVSSPQFDEPERGFSFRLPALLDMRMDRSQLLTAEEIINHWPEADLAQIFFEYGEERLSRRIARQVVQKRPFYSTVDLAEAIARSVPPKYRYGRIHPATRVFQALRIAVNDEMGSLERFLARSPKWLKVGGILGIITFHSLEDRRVKHFFRESPLLEVITKKPIVPDPEEVERNPRSRSAKLRFARRVTD
jgi:16S rRNA (cytosine1402-N4)-methyltransferase